MLLGLVGDRRIQRRVNWLLLLAFMSASWLPMLALRPGSLGHVLAAQDKDEAAKDEPAKDDAAKDEPAAADGEAAGDKDAAEGDEREDVLTWLVKASGPFGALIAIQSVLLVALIVSNSLLLRRMVFIPPAFVEQFEQMLNNKQYNEAFELAKKDDSFLARVLIGGLQRLSRGYEESVAGMEQVGEDENMAVDHKLSYISIIGSTAPMLGLLGTVQGMVSSFSVIAQSKTSPKPSELADGITLALVTTMEGLIVAIPAVTAYALLKNRQSRLVLDVGMVADGLMARFSPAAKKGASSAAPGTAAPAAAER